MANNNWNNYTEKTATPVDADEVMVRDSADGKNKKLLFGTFWKWVAKKLNEATISELQTSNKTIVGALNQLNSETPRKNVTSLEEYIKTAPYGISLCDCQIAKDNPAKGQMSICLSYVDEQHKWALQYVFSYNKIFYRVMSNLVFNDWAKIVG
jgi:ferredoxin-thioredoxin reductase catalytic subunit